MTPVAPNGGLTRRQLMAAAGGAVVLLGLEACGGGGGTSFDHRTFGLSVSAPPEEIVGEALKVGKVLGRRPGIVNSYVAWHWDNPFPAKFVRDATDAGIVPQITWEAWDPTKGVAEQPRYRHTALGGFDDYVDRFVRGAAEVGLPFNLRYAHEMNGWWYPWAVGSNGNSAEDYVEGWRRMHAAFDRAGVDQVTWTWSVNTVEAARPGTLPVDVASCYPGDEFVDLVSLDAYDFDGSLSPGQAIGSSLAKLASVAPGKPLWVNEIGTARSGGRADWVAECIALLRTTPVEALVWFDIAPPGQPDFRVSTPNPTASAVRKALEKW